MHYNQVHATDNKTPKKKKASVPLDKMFFSRNKKDEPLKSATKSPAVAVKASPKPNIKLGSSNPKRNQPSVAAYLDPTLNINCEPETGLERWALGTMYKMVHQGANKCISNLTVIDYYNTGVSMVKEYHQVLKNSTELSKVPEMKNIHPPPRVRLNNHNIVDVQKVLFEVSC